MVLIPRIVRFPAAAASDAHGHEGWFRQQHLDTCCRGGAGGSGRGRCSQGWNAGYCLPTSAPLHCVEQVLRVRKALGVLREGARLGGQQAPAVGDSLVPAAGGILGPAVDVIHETQDDERVWILHVYVIEWPCAQSSPCLPIVHPFWLAFFPEEVHSGSR
jgi:hypothetical protein